MFFALEYIEYKTLNLSDLEGLEGNPIFVEGEIIENYSSSMDIQTNDGSIRVTLLSSTGINVNKSKGDKVSIYGILSQYNGLYRILPRYMSDISIVKKQVNNLNQTKSSTLNKTNTKSSLWIFAFCDFVLCIYWYIFKNSINPLKFLKSNSSETLSEKEKDFLKKYYDT